MPMHSPTAGKLYSTELCGAQQAGWKSSAILEWKKRRKQAGPTILLFSMTRMGFSLARLAGLHIEWLQ